MKSYRGGFKVIVVIMFVLCQTVTAQVWEEIGINLPAGDTASSSTEITFINKDIGWVFAEFYKGDVYLKNLYRTTNGGDSWQTISSNDNVMDSRVALFAMEPDFFYMIRVKKAFFTTDGGNTWDSTFLGYSDYGYSSLYFFNEKRGITFYNHSLITTDGGKTWEKKGELSLPSDVYFSNDKIGWATGWSLVATDNSYFANTTDGGETWKYLDYQIPAFFISENKIDFIDSLKGFIIGETLTKTTDGGKNWFNDYSVYGYDIGFLDDKNGWISSAGNIFRTSDGGETWKTQFDSVQNISFRKLIILKKDKIAYTLGFSYKDNHATLFKADLSNITDVEDKNKTLPGGFYLAQNYPNPFNPATNISYQIPVSSYVTLSVYDVLGREIAVLVNEEKKPGSYKVSFNAGGYNLTSGVYFYRIRARDYSHTRKLVLQK